MRATVLHVPIDIRQLFRLQGMYGLAFLRLRIYDGLWPARGLWVHTW